MESESRATVLIVEDDAANRRALQEVLSGNGYELATAGSGEEALRKVLAEEFAVILLDVNLPGIDGFETAELIRSRRRSCKTPIIFLTGMHPESTNVFRGYEVGAVDYMVKPIVPGVLRSKVAVFVELYEKNARIAAQNDELRAMASRSEQRFYDLVQGLDAIVWESETNGRYTFVSERAADILGYPAEEWSASQDFRSKLIVEEDRQQALEAYRRAVFEHQSVVVEFRVYRSDGQLAWMRDHVHVVHNQQNRSAQLRGVMFDVSAHKQTELRLQRQAEQLAAADRHRNEFLAMLGHELRNPLAPIQNAVEWLRIQQPGASAGPGIETIGRQVAHITRLVDDLLDVARITGGKIALQRKRCGLNDVIGSALETAGPLVAAKRHKLSATLASDPLSVDGDPVRLAQVIANLIHNAAKYTPEGGEIEVCLERQGEFGLVRVRDNGLGIAPEMLHRVFDLFTQANEDGQLSAGGLGVGLTLVRRLVEMHGGVVEAHSAGRGCGSEFTVRLPLANDILLGEFRDTAAGMEERPMDGRRILVVDDNKDAASSLGMLLNAMGHEVETVHDGFEALDRAGASSFHVVFLDIGLPGMDGYEVARRLRAVPGVASLRIVALTGFGKQDRGGEDCALFDDFLLKPASVSALEQALRGGEGQSPGGQLSAASGVG
jgi:PAS domain S-box-containing protein